MHLNVAKSTVATRTHTHTHTHTLVETVHSTRSGFGCGFGFGGSYAFASAVLRLGRVRDRPAEPLHERVAVHWAVEHQVQVWLRSELVIREAQHHSVLPEAVAHDVGVRVLVRIDSHKRDRAAGHRCFSTAQGQNNRLRQETLHGRRPLRDTLNADRGLEFARDRGVGVQEHIRAFVHRLRGSSAPQLRNSVRG